MYVVLASLLWGSKLCKYNSFRLYEKRKSVIYPIQKEECHNFSAVFYRIGHIISPCPPNYCNGTGKRNTPVISVVGDSGSIVGCGHLYQYGVQVGF